MSRGRGGVPFDRTVRPRASEVLAPSSRRLREQAAGRSLGEHLKDVSTEVADLERRIERQIANLEAEDATPTLRQRITARIAELEEAVEDPRRRAAALAQEVADAPPTAADLATALDQLPLLDRLPELPQPELRTLFDSLRLQVAFQPGEAAVDVEVALFADEPSNRRQEVAEVQSVHPTGQKSKKYPQVEGLPIALSKRHAKIRRDGFYRRRAP
jgi:hypothetical protein